MKKRKHILLKVLILLLLIAAALVADSRFRLVLTEYEISSAELPASFDGFRIVQLSDIHGAVFGRNNERLAAKVAAAEPDIIAITGDLADGATDMDDIDTLLGELVSIASVYYVSGNHEWAASCIPELSALFDKHGVTYLSDEYVLLERGGESIALAGVEDPNSWNSMRSPEKLVDIINKEQSGKYIVLLGHRNYWVEKYPQLDVDIILCGHAHGGIVRLPFAGGVLGTGFEFFPDWVDGVNKSGSYSMVVSRGIGNSIPVPRFLNNPEIVAVTLKSA